MNTAVARFANRFMSRKYSLKEEKRDLLVSDRRMLGLVHDWRELLRDGIDDMETREMEKRLSIGKP